MHRLILDAVSFVFVTSLLLVLQLQKCVDIKSLVINECEGLSILTTRSSCVLYSWIKLAKSVVHILRYFFRNHI